MTRVTFARAGLVSSLICGAVAALNAQSPQAPPSAPRFDVASVKPGLSPYERGRADGLAAARGEPPLPPAPSGIQTQPGGRFVAGTTVKRLVAHAFDIRDYQVEGGPRWIEENYFYVIANAGAEARPEDVRSMLRTLLVERFGLRTHNETRQAPLHVLTAARSDGRPGSGLKPSTPECVQLIEDRKNGTAPPASLPQGPRDFPTTPECGRSSTISRANGSMTLLYGGVELALLVQQISSEMDGPVIDRTGLSGLFDIALEYQSQRQITGRVTGLDPNTGADTPPPTLVPALERQLGLKLEKQVGPLPVVVIDAAEQPTPN